MPAPIIRIVHVDRDQRLTVMISVGWSRRRPGMDLTTTPDPYAWWRDRHKKDSRPAN
jgi:hypothetical protein